MSDYQYLTDTGVIIPDTGTLRAEVEGEYRAVFGQDLVVTANTPQGVLITAETLARSNVLQNNAAVANQINPNLAGGVFLDAIMALTGDAREAATFSLVPGVELLGLAGTVLPAGSQASLVDGTLFESVSEVTLDILGEGVVDFQAVEAGPVAVGVGALNQIVTAVLGWDTVTNPVVATPGRTLESDLEARSRRKNTLSLQNVALPEAITSGLYATPNVKSLSFRENKTAVTATIDGITIGPHGIYACVDGGTDLEVATALLANSSLGSTFTGGTSVDVVEPSSGQTYEVLFDRPTLIPVQAKVTIRNLSSLLDVQAAVRAAVVAYANGEIPGEAGFIVGASVSAFELAGAVNAQNPGIYVQKCEVSLVSVTSWSTDEIAIALDELATITSGAVQVVVL